MAIIRQLWRPDIDEGDVTVIEEYDNETVDQVKTAIMVIRRGQATKTGAEAQAERDQLQADVDRKNLELVPELQKTLSSIEVANTKFQKQDGKLVPNLDHIKDSTKRAAALKSVLDRQKR